MSTSHLHPYMAFAGDPHEGAVLVFAHTAREAVVVSASDIQGWTDCAYIEVRARRLREHEAYLLRMANPAKLSANIPHVIDDPPSCRSCETWGHPIGADGICSVCAHERNQPTATSACHGT